ncbi:MAG: hypothetical protein WCB23_25845, partial [Pseudolabrys sp.]
GYGYESCVPWVPDTPASEASFDNALERDPQSTKARLMPNHGRTEFKVPMGNILNRMFHPERI